MVAVNVFGWSGARLFLCRLLAFSLFVFVGYFSFFRQHVVQAWVLGVAVFLCGMFMFLSIPFDLIDDTGDCHD